MQYHGRTGEDLFPLSVLKYDTVLSRLYLDVGTDHPVKHNPSFLLEKNGWYGVTVSNTDMEDAFAEIRQNPFIRDDPATTDWATLLRRNGIRSDWIHYAFIRVPSGAAAIIKRFPFDSVNIKCIVVHSEDAVIRKFATSTIENTNKYTLLRKEGDMDWWLHKDVMCCVPKCTVTNLQTTTDPIETMVDIIRNPF